MKKLSFLSIGLFAALMMVGCGEDKKQSDESTKKEHKEQTTNKKGSKKDCDLPISKTDRKNTSDEPKNSKQSVIVEEGKKNAYDYKTDQKTGKVNDDEMVKATPTPNPSRSYLKMSIQAAKQMFPVDAGYGVTMVDLNLEGDYLMYEARCDESLIDIDQLNANKSIAKQMIISGVKQEDDPSLKMLVNLCKESNTGLGYRYRGSDTGKTCVVRCRPTEL